MKAKGTIEPVEEQEEQALQIVEKHQPMVLANLQMKPETVEHLLAPEQDKVNSIINQIKAIGKIETASQHAAAKALYILAKKTKVDVDQRRKIYKEPYKACVDLIDGKFNPLGKTLDPPIIELDKKMNSFEAVENARIAKEKREAELAAKKVLDDLAKENEKHAAVIDDIAMYSINCLREMLAATIKADLLSCAKVTLERLAVHAQSKHSSTTEIATRSIANIKELGKMKIEYFNLLNNIKSAADNQRFEELEKHLAYMAKEYADTSKAIAEEAKQEIADDEIIATQSAMSDMAATDTILSSQEVKSAKSYSYTFKIQDITKIPASWLKLDETAIREYMKVTYDQKGNKITANTIVNGVLIEVKSQTRGA